MARRGWHGVWFLLMAATMAGCGGAPDDGAVPPATPASTAGRKGVVFVGFDASEPLVDAMRQGKIQGLVVQNPLRMGELRVKTMVKHLEKQPVEPKVSTGETLVTPENMNDPEIAKLIHPPQVENTSGASLSGAKSKKWRVIVIPKGTTHEFWKTLHAGTLKAADELGNVDVIWQGPAEGRRSRPADPARAERDRRRRRRDRAGAARCAGPGRPGRGGGRQGDSGRDFRLGARIDEDGELRGDQQLQRRRAGRAAARRAA